jgi:hypothetical protein
MTADRYVHIVAGSFVLISMTLGIYHSPWWFLWTAFVGLNLFQSGITNWCLLTNILRRFGVKG